MKIRTYREVEFINREKEIDFLRNRFNEKPERILWLYGPKSTGKTTLIEYLLEKELDNSYYKKFITFRGKIFGNYDMFLESMLEPIDEDEEGEINSELNFGVFKLSAKKYKKIKDKKRDFFEEIKEHFINSKKKNILVIDEIQALENIYIDKEKELFNEFLNFCIRLTKELHLAHVVILTSNTIFLEKIYNNAKMKVTSEFKLIEHLDYSEIKEWLETKNFKEEDIKLIYDYLGGSVAHIKKLLDNYKYYNSLQEYLDREELMAISEINVFIEQNELSDEEIEKFNFVAKVLVEEGKFDNNKNKGYLKIISKFAQVEILFYEPTTNVTFANSKIYVKAFEKILEEYNDRT
jgi:AAA+ ATPase superfamily predicted ATPase